MSDFSKLINTGENQLSQKRKKFRGRRNLTNLRTYLEDPWDWYINLPPMNGSCLMAKLDECMICHASCLWRCISKVEVFFKGNSRSFYYGNRMGSLNGIFSPPRAWGPYQNPLQNGPDCRPKIGLRLYSYL